MGNTPRTIPENDPISRISARARRDLTLDALAKTRPMRGVPRPYDPGQPLVFEYDVDGVGTLTYAVHPLDVSQHGMGALVAPFLNVGLQGILHLRLHNQTVRPIAVTVENCSYVRSMAHLVTFGFDEPNDPEALAPTPTLRVSIPPSRHASVYSLAQFLEVETDVVERYPAADRIILLESLAWASQGEPGLLLPDEIRSDDRIAIIDLEGTILGVNPAWIEFASEGGYAGDAFVGSSYTKPLEACAEHHGGVRSLCEGLASVRAGQTPEYRYLYDCGIDENGVSEWYAVSHAASERIGRPCIAVRHTLIQSDTLQAG